MLPDIDECARGTNTCHEDATCTDNLGSYTCDCKPGYSGDGATCDGIVTILSHSTIKHVLHNLWWFGSRQIKNT